MALAAITTNMQSILLKIIAGILLLSTQAAFAADMYRCGNSFQDTPCANSNNSKVIKGATKTTGSPVQNGDLSPIKIDADCKQRGEAAKKIMWLREVGKTREQQLESAQDSHTQTLIRDVYNHRGSSIEVRNVIEQECMQQKEQDLLADKLMIEAMRLKRNGNIPVESAANSKAQLKSSSEPATAETKVSGTEPHTTRDDKKSTCTALKAKAEQFASLRRKGGSASYMNDLKQEQEAIENSIRSSGC